MKLLRIDSSGRRNSISRRLTEAFVMAWQAENPSGQVITRDPALLQAAPIGDEWVTAAMREPAQRTPVEREALALSDELIGELVEADLVTIGAPMYNFSIAPALKTWIDQIVRPGRTVAYSPEGSKGLLKGKKVVVLTARGGAYSQGNPRAAFDFQEPYLRAIFGFIGLTEVTFIHAENQQRRDEAERTRLAAIEKITQFAGAFARA